MLVRLTRQIIPLSFFCTHKGSTINYCSLALEGLGNYLNRQATTLPPSLHRGMYDTFFKGVLYLYLYVYFLSYRVIIKAFEQAEGGH